MELDRNGETVGTLNGKTGLYPGTGSHSLKESDLKELIRRFIYDQFLKEEDLILNDNDSLIENGIIDSIGVLELVAFLERTFGFRVEDEEIVPENLDSVDRLVAYLQSKLVIKRANDPES